MKWNLTIGVIMSKAHQIQNFLSLIIDDCLFCKAHINQIMSKMNTVCFAIRTIQAIMSPQTLRRVYFAYIYSIMSYSIIFCGNQWYSEKIFKIQKRVIRIITNSRMRDSCRELFKKLEILPLYSQYIFSLSIFVIKTNIHFTQTIRSIVSTQDLELTYTHS